MGRLFRKDGPFVRAYIDDNIIFRKTKEVHAYTDLVICSACVKGDL